MDGSSRCRSDAADQASRHTTGSISSGVRPAGSIVGELRAVGAQRGQGDCSVGLHCLDIGGLGGLALGVLQHQPDMTSAGPTAIFAHRSAADVLQQLDQAAGHGRLLGP